MSATIWKFDLPVQDSQVVEMPPESKILAVGAQDTTGHSVQLWAEVRPNDAVAELRTFHIAGTGHPLPPGDHIGTVITAGGALVWHVFEERP